MTDKSKSLIKAKNTALSLPAGQRDLDQYITSAYHHPVLSAEEEHALALRYYQHKDIDAAHKLVMHNLRFVIQVARGYSGYGLPLSDLVQEGSIGLMKAVKKFNPTVGVRLISFAVYWIRAEIHEFVLQNWRIVKVATTKAQRKLFFNLRSMKKRIAWLNHKEVQDIADQLGVKPEEVTEMEARLSSHDLSFDLPAESENDDSQIAPAALLPDTAATPEETAEQSDLLQYRQQQFEKAFAKIDRRSREIIQARWLSEKQATLQELGKKFNISPERVRQIENKTIQKLRSTST